MILLSLLLAADPARGAVLATLSRAGFFGEYSAGAVFAFREFHEAEISAGAYSSGEGREMQLNAAYRYVPWTVQGVHLRWQPVFLGGFVVSTVGGGRFFFNSPSKYPYKNYYDETAVRWGFETGSSWMWPSGWGVAYRLRISDAGLIALYNNRNKDLEFSMSSGLSLLYSF